MLSTLFKHSIIAFAIISTAAHAEKTVEIANGQYTLVAVRCELGGPLREATPVTFKDFSNTMVQAHVPGRDSLAPYYFTFTMDKLNDTMSMHWSQLHTGNATADARNHTPFYASFITMGKLHGNYLSDMQLFPSTIQIDYLETEFNDQEFSDEDITGRMAKDKHLGKYSSVINWHALPEKGPSGKNRFELFELDGGFGAPRHLLCGAVDAKMSYVVEPLG